MVSFTRLKTFKSRVTRVSFPIILTIFILLLSLNSLSQWQYKVIKNDGKEVKIEEIK